MSPNPPNPPSHLPQKQTTKIKETDPSQSYSTATPHSKQEELTLTTEIHNLKQDNKELSHERDKWIRRINQLREQNRKMEEENELMIAFLRRV
jgi:hypothetical protein